jgi:hypothetical protein
MVSVSCFYCHYNIDPVNFTFIQYKNFIKVCLNKRVVILTNEQLVSNHQLFQIFKLSLLCTRNSSNVQMEQDIYGVFTTMYWKNLRFTNYYNFIELEKSNCRSPKNPLNTLEPKRSSSVKKLRKFMKLFNKYITKIKNPNDLICEYLIKNDFDELMEYFTKYINYNKNNPQINILSRILHNYGVDVYSNILRFM